MRVTKDPKSKYIIHWGFRSSMPMFNKYKIIVVRTRLFSDPRMTLGSYVKGLNNMICRKWAWKAGPWSQVSSLVVVFYGSLYMCGLGLTNSAFHCCRLKDLSPRTTFEEHSILPFLPFIRFSPPSGDPFSLRSLSFLY